MTNLENQELIQKQCQQVQKACVDRSGTGHTNGAMYAIASAILLSAQLVVSAWVNKDK